MGAINTYTLKQYKEIYPRSLEQHKLEYEDYNEYTFINAEIENYAGLIDIENIGALDFLFEKLSSDEEIIENRHSTEAFKKAAIKSNLSSFMIIDYLEQRKQELENDLITNYTTIPATENILFDVGFKFKNNFDTVSEISIYKFFSKELIDKGYLTKEKLEEYLTLGFEENKKPVIKFSFDKIKTQREIINIFYKYYKIIAQKPYGKKKIYLELLTNYFIGYDYNTIESNFSK